MVSKLGHACYAKEGMFQEVLLLVATFVISPSRWNCRSAITGQ